MKKNKMNYKKWALLTMSIIAIAFSNPTNAQTCRIKTSTLHNGNAVYTEVYEFDYVEIKPEFPGGGRSLISFINSNRKYPEEAYQLGIEGRVMCSFIVLPDGKLSHIKILRGVEPSLNEEALRLVSLMPHWSPGKINDQPVPVRVVTCIPFRK